MSKHTPGPWLVTEYEFKHSDERSFGVKITAVNGSFYRGDIEAAIALINSTHDLLSALEECLPCLGWAHDSDEELKWEHEQGNGYAELILRARAAIAKAKGK